MSFNKGVLLSKTWQPLLQTVRYNRRVNIQRPRAPHYDRARLEALCKPIFPEPIEKFLPLSQKCKKNEEEDIKKFRIDNPFENLLAKEFLRLYKESSLVAICHRNSMNAEDRFNMFIRIRKEGMILKEHSKHIAKLALQGTKFEPVLPLCDYHNNVIFCPDPNVSALLKILKKTPQLILLAAIIDGYFASVNQVAEYAQFKDLSSAQAHLVSVLNSAAQSVVSGLNQHQTMLVAGLDHYVNIQQLDLNSNDSNENKKKELSPSSADESQS